MDQLVLVAPADTSLLAFFISVQTKNKPSSEYYDKFVFILNSLVYLTFLVFVHEIRNLIDKNGIFFQSFTLPLSEINFVKNSAFRSLYNHVDLIPSFFSVECPVLTVGRLVKTSPNNCVTSPAKHNTKCSFSCPQGYYLQGPSKKQCGANDQWTDSAKPVTCKGKFSLICQFFN